MANTKKNASANIKDTAAVKTEAASAEATAAPKKETAAAKKEPAKKTGTKKSTAKAANKKPAAKPGRKPAAAKTEKKTAAKPGRKPAANAEKTSAAKKTTSRKKGTSYEDVFEAARKKLLAANITRIKRPIAANIELTGSVTGDFYVYIDADKQEISVEPYKYNDYNVNIRADADGLLAVMKGKKNIYDALADGDVHIYGETKKAILLINAGF